MTNTTGTQQPAQVPEGATQAGEKREGWRGAPTLGRDSLFVWTERMLKALERGNDKRKWHTLTDSRAQRDSQPD